MVEQVKNSIIPLEPKVEFYSQKSEQEYTNLTEEKLIAEAILFLKYYSQAIHCPICGDDAKSLHLSSINWISPNSLTFNCQSEICRSISRFHSMGFTLSNFNLFMGNYLYHLQ